MKKTNVLFTVVNIDRHENEERYHLTCDGGSIKFWAGKKPWSFKCSTSGVSGKQVSKIIDEWFICEKTANVKIGDTVLA